MELIVKAKDIFLEYAGRDILDIEELEIYSYDRIGLVGDNGAGKTSLLKILSGNLTIADALPSQRRRSGAGDDERRRGDTRQDCLCALPACKRDLC